jgi:hypothetical protein
MRLLVVIALLFVTTALCACGDSSEPLPTSTNGSGQVGNITGTVFKDEDGNGLYDLSADTALQGVTVCLWRGSERVAVGSSDDTGSYSLAAPVGGGYTLELTMPSRVKCYDPQADIWGHCSMVNGREVGVSCPGSGQDIAASYRMLNYGPKGFLWELWHAGPVFERANVVLVHGYRFASFGSDGRCDKQFGRLDDLLQTREDAYNAWLFEFEHGSWGTLDRLEVYADRLNQALELVDQLTGNRTCSVIAHSIGGFVVRESIVRSETSRIDKLLTLATPHLGIKQMGPVDLQWLLNWSYRVGPKARPEVIPGSRFLWDLNFDPGNSVPQDFASIAGYSEGHTDGLVEISTASLVQSNEDGSVVQRLYFAGVNRSHPDINNIQDASDEVFQLIRHFLTGGVADLSEYRPPERPADYAGLPYIVFALTEEPPTGYPEVVLIDTGRTYGSSDVFTQNDETKEGHKLYAVQLWPDDAGEARVYYAPGRFSTIRVTQGQSTMVTRPIGD